MTFIYSILQFTLPLTGKRAKNERKTCQSLFTFSHIDLPDFFTLTFLEEKLQFWGNFWSTHDLGLEMSCLRHVYELVFAMKTRIIRFWRPESEFFLDFPGSIPTKNCWKNPANQYRILKLNSRQDSKCQKQRKNPWTDPDEEVMKISEKIIHLLDFGELLVHPRPMSKVSDTYMSSFYQWKPELLDFGDQKVNLFLISLVRSHRRIVENHRNWWTAVYC